MRISFKCAGVIHVSALLSAAVFLGFSLQATAQEERRVGIEEIIVTAARREVSIQDTPVAVTAFSGEELERAGVFDIYHMTTQVPNMMVSSQTAGDSMYISIRGVTGTGSTPTTAFHMDGAYIPRTSGRSAYFHDLERMEVLRGPQGTLWGRNSTSGAVNVISRKPNFDGFDASAEISLGDYNLTEVKGMFNVPLSDNVAARVSVLKTSHDGYVNNGPLVANDGNDADEVSIRAHLLWNISDATSLLLTADAYRREGVGKVTSSGGCPPGVLGAPVDGCIEQGQFISDSAKYNPLNTQGFRDNADNNFTLALNHSFNSWDLSYIAGYREHDRIEFYDQEATADWNGEFELDIDTASVQHQLTLTSTFDGPFQAIIGAFVIDDESDSFRVIRRAVFRPPPVGLNRLRAFYIEKNATDESDALFFNGSYDFSDQWTLSAGVRYTKDRIRQGGIADENDPTRGTHTYNDCCIDNGEPIDYLGPPPRAVLGDVEWEETTWRVGLDYNINDDTMTYGSISNGYKAGGFNNGANDATQNTNPAFISSLPYNPEYIDAIEVGIKTQFMDDRAQLNVAVFHYDYTDMQQSVVARAPDGFSDVGGTFNVGEVTIQGVELEGTLLFGNEGSVDLAVGLLDAEFDSLVGFNDALTAEVDNLDLRGNSPINAPDFNATLVLTPTVWQVGAGTLTPRLQIHYESEAWLRVDNNPLVDVRESYSRTDVSLRYEADDRRFYIEGWVRNLEDDPLTTWGACTTNVAGGPRPNPTTDCRRMYGDPMTAGVTFGFRL